MVALRIARPRRNQGAKDMTDTSPAAVAARVAHMRFCHNNHDADLIEAIASQLAAANARADRSRDAALEDVAVMAHAFAAENQWHPSSVTKLVTRILALRDKPAPAVTVQEAALVLWQSDDGVDPRGSCLGHSWPIGMATTLRAIAGGGDE